MQQDAGLAFRFIQINYKYGLLDDVGAIAGEALEQVMLERGMDMEDLLNALDGASELTVERVNLLVEKWSPLVLKLAANERMTRIQAWLLSRPPVRRTALKAATALLRKLTKGTGTLVSSDTKLTKVPVPLVSPLVNSGDGGGEVGS